MSTYSECCSLPLSPNHRQIDTYPEHHFSHRPDIRPVVPSQSAAQTIHIRHAEPRDALALNALFAEEQVIYWTIGLPFTPIQHDYKQLTEAPEGEYRLVACADDAVIGAITLTRYAPPRLHHVASLSSLAVSPAYQGQGVGSKLLETALDLADNWLNLVRLELFIYADHILAIRLYEKYGFVVEGILQSAAFRAGHYADALIMARINHCQSGE